MVERLILHAGTPKTGTTSLQAYLHLHRGSLLREGILYPACEDSQQKHQWIVPALLAHDGGGFGPRVEQLLAQADPAVHTIVLSTEGLFNHWWDFSPAGRDALASLPDLLPVSVWTWFREPVSFVRSNYVQMLENPRGYAPSYGRDRSVDEMLDDRWFAKHLDYIGFVREVDALLGPGATAPFAYRRNTIDDFLDALGVEHRGFVGLDEHRTVGALGVSLLRLLNRHTIADANKHRGARIAGHIDAMAGPLSRPLALAPSTQDRIRGLAFDSVNALERDYGLELGASGVSHEPSPGSRGCDA